MVRLASKPHVERQSNRISHHPLLGQVWSSLQLRNYPALAHDVYPVADADKFGQLTTNHKDGHATVRDLIDQLVDLGLGANVDAPGGLVQYEQSRRGA
jgi:hypothetical protein